MTTKINASTAGLTETVDASGILELQTANTTALIIDASQNANFASTGAITVPVGTTAQRPTGVNGMIRYNSNTAVFEFYANNTWTSANVTPPPVISVAPVISGTAVVGQNLTSTTGTWTGSVTGYYYQWLSNSTVISNATANVFTLTSTQNNTNITCNVTAYNVAGNSTPSTSNTLGPVTTGVPVSYVAVAGGGGGGGGDIAGGGGAGGYLANTLSLTIGAVYTITVGGGGNQSVNGSNSSISGTGITTVTTIGGGKGAQYETSNCASGGSGGGGAQGFLTGASGTSGQGNAGGNGTIGGGASTGGGGGGAGAVGGNGVNGGQPGNGGNGLQSSITGSAVYYAGGGGGGGRNSSTSATGGQGGGGAGGNSSNQNASAGTANTGGGGGGAAGSSGSSGGGGSGVIILSIPTTNFTNTYSGSSVVKTTSGSNTILQFNSSGTYTA